jgi:hypothetical protein
MNNNGIVRIIERKERIAQASPTRHTNIQRAAQSLSRRNVDQAITELLNEALGRLTVLCYERGDDGQLVNVDGVTGRVLVPLPWGKAGYAKWGLSPSEGDTMRAIMFTRQRNGVPLFFFDRSRRAWFVNLEDYPDGEVVLAQIQEWEIGVAEYREARAKGRA